MMILGLRPKAQTLIDLRILWPDPAEPLASEVGWDHLKFTIEHLRCEFSMLRCNEYDFAWRE